MRLTCFSFPVYAKCPVRCRLLQVMNFLRDLLGCGEVGPQVVLAVGPKICMDVRAARRRIRRNCSLHPRLGGVRSISGGILRNPSFAHAPFHLSRSPNQSRSTIPDPAHDWMSARSFII